MSLEDKILKQNIPGRYSSWESMERNDSRREEEDDDDDDSSEQCTTEPIEPESNDYVYDVAPRYNTGVKGVLADYQQENQRQEYIKKLDKLEKQRICERNSDSDTNTLSRDIELNLQSKDEHDEFSDADSDQFLDEDDEAFAKQYREKRLTQLQHSSKPKSWPVFGKVLTVNAIEFADMVDDLDPLVFCVIHLYEQHISDCRLLDSYLEILAERMPYCCFLRLQATSAKRDLDMIALPSVLIYRNQILVANLTPITASLGHAQKFDLHHIQRILESYGILDP